MLGARDTQPIAPIRLATCDRCGTPGLCRTVNDDRRWCLDCLAMPPAPRELPEPGPVEVARGSRP